MGNLEPYIFIDDGKSLLLFIWEISNFQKFSSKNLNATVIRSYDVAIGLCHCDVRFCVEFYMCFVVVYFDTELME